MLLIYDNYLMRVASKDRRQLCFPFYRARQLDPEGLLRFLQFSYLKTSGKASISPSDRGRIRAYTADRKLLKESTLKLLERYEGPEERAVLIWALGKMRYKNAGPSIMDILKTTQPLIDEGSAKVKMAAIEALKNIKYLPAFRALLNSSWKSEEETAAALEAASVIIEEFSGEIKLKDDEIFNVNRFTMHKNPRIRQAAADIIAIAGAESFGLQMPRFLDPFKRYIPETARA